ncbi:MAG TPA: protein kinase, partial [Thermoanaerobaculia bacterium]|nr:protein kinase [Thermoanaerobaculia bacterium]
MSALSPGSHLGRFRIVSQLGAGGMGEVYKAHDPALSRSVALKVLPAALVASADRLRRFEQEARAASGLSHPHIVAIHEIGVSRDAGAPDIHYIAMELVEGRTLREAIQSGLPLRDALEVLSQVADALAKAHSAGIVHRDLKPENIMLTAEGYAKVLDFGLAKLLEKPQADPEDSGETLQKNTSEGIVVGTPAYMSPEQVRGQKVDHRSDIFSFGCILYETVTRRRPFAADSKFDVLHQIVHTEPPPIGELAPSTPGELRRMIRRCMAKDPERRYQSMKDIAIELRDLAQDFDSLTGTPALLAPESPASKAWWWAAAGLGALAVLAAWLVSRRAEPAASAPLVRGKLTQLTRQGGYETYPRLSPDGNFLVYVSAAAGKTDIYLQRLGGFHAMNLTGKSKAPATQPAISPKGDLIAFRSEADGGGIFVMGATGESVRRISDFCYDPTWSPDGNQIACSTINVPNPLSKGGFGQLWILDLATGEKRMAGDHDTVQPSWSPNGHRIAFWSNRNLGSQRDIWTVKPDGTDPKLVTDDPEADWGVVWSGDGKYLYFSSDRGGTMGLWRIRIDEKSGDILGPPEPLPTASRWNGPLDVSRDGKRVVFSSAEIRAEIYRLDLDAATRRPLGPAVPVFHGITRAVESQISPDGQWLAFRSDGEQEDIFLVRPDGTELRQLTNDVPRDRGLSWTPDGSRLLFYSDRGGRAHNFWSIRPDGSSVQQLTALDTSIWYPRMSPDGKWLCGHNQAGSYLIDLSAPLPVKQVRKLPPIGPDQIFRAFQWSPDGCCLAGRAYDERGVPLPGLHLYSMAEAVYTMIPRNLASGTDLDWFPDSRHLVFRSSYGSIQIADRLTGRATEILSGTPPVGFVGLSLSTDGTSLYFVRDSAEAD